MPQLIIATSNPGKVAEFRDLLAGCGWEVVGPADMGLTLDVEETGADYAENALIKADAFVQTSGIAALADDSGLEVDALNGEPGPLHHLRGWDGHDQAERIQILLDALKDAPPPWTGRYRAVLVAVLADGRVVQEDGACEGVIIDTLAGSAGFGYDPVFYLPEQGKTMAQLSLQEKNRISHRGIAAAKMRQRLRELAAQ
ncbi:MAG: non-canonical purine NTP pyrophosphatase [Dehalococcoidia bacterium]|nr:non-canonical purine NTP pyrophosphatase [Dehalococcoidia bacterium]